MLQFLPLLVKWLFGVIISVSELNPREQSNKLCLTGAGMRLMTFGNKFYNRGVCCNYFPVTSLRNREMSQCCGWF